eukprot:5100978-Amphidinium_carterae.3
MMLSQFRKPLCFVTIFPVLSTQLTSWATMRPLLLPGKPTGGPVGAWQFFVDTPSLSKGWRRAFTVGRWAHHLIPFEGGLHVFNVYGYSSDKERAQELNREVCLEIFAAVAALGNRQIFILGDWNFEPDNFPIDLLNGGQ